MSNSARPKLSAADLVAAADTAEKLARSLRQAANEAYEAELAARPLAERMIFSATSRCRCGQGLAYDPLDKAVRVGTGAWRCSGLILGTSDEADGHSILPFAYFEVVSETAPSAGGQTTRPAGL
jgi:hypothetical protein